MKRGGSDAGIPPVTGRLLTLEMFSEMKNDIGFVYVVQMEGHPLYKIGRSSNVPRRMSEFGIQLPFPHKLLFAHRVPSVHYAESDFHQDFTEFHRNGEWFELPQSALSYIQSKLLVIQAYDLTDRVAKSFADDPVFSHRLKRYGTLFIRLAERINRRLGAFNDACKALMDERIEMDALSAEFIG